MESHLLKWAAKPGLFYADTANIPPRDGAPATANAASSANSPSVGASSALTTDTATTTTTTVTTTTTTTAISNAPLHRVAAADAANAASAFQPVMTLPTDRTTWATTLLHHQKTGVPAMHQTIIDGDYDMANMLLAAGADIGTCILSPLAEKEAIDTDKRPAFSIVHANEKKSDPTEAVDDEQKYFTSFKFIPPPELSTAQIVDFVLHLKSKAPQENLHYQGANAITLALLSSAPMDFLRTLCETAARQQPALLSTRDKLGRTPLTIAAADGNLPIVKLLLALKVNPEIQDGQGLKPLDHALRNAQAEVTQLLIRHGIADPKNTKWKIASLGPRHTHEGPVSLLTTLFEQRDMNTLLDYQQQSVRHRVAVFKVLISLCKQAVDSGAPKALEALLDFAKQLLTTHRLAKIAVAVARRSGKLQALLSVLSHLGDAGFPQKRLAALRDAAGKSRDPAMLELAVSLDQSLSKLISGKARPNPQQKAQLNRLLALAMQVRDEELILKVQERGASLDLDDPALAGLPMIGILADLRSPKMLRSALLRPGAKSVDHRMHALLLDAIDDIQSGEGVVTVTAAFDGELSGYALHQLLCRAVHLQDAWAVDELVKAGANVEYLPTLTMGSALIHSGEGTPMSAATATGNIDMVKKLIALGGKIRLADVTRAYRVSDEFGIAVESLT